MGGILGTALLVFFIGWIGFYYHALAGRECSCFPLIKRTIGPMFFVSDGVMVLLGLAAWAWSSPVRKSKVPAGCAGNVDSSGGRELWGAEG